MNFLTHQSYTEYFYSAIGKRKIFIFISVLHDKFICCTFELSLWTGGYSQDTWGVLREPTLW